MKRIVSFFISLVMVVLCVPAFFAASPVVAGAETLPSAVDLSTTSYLPPIGNQGGVGCCVSMAATYMQLTNAYARYLGWNSSSGDASLVFAPRFTYNLGGAATAEVYHILQEQGAPTQSVTLTNGNTYSMSYSGGVTGAAAYNQLAKNWGTYDGVWDLAQNYRISNFDQVWARDVCDYDFKTTAGQAFVQRIKENLNAGNVVVTGGYPDRWVTDLVTISNKGTYGKTGEKAIPYSTDVSSGGHQVSIVGYDDNITCVKNGVTLKGAFKMANSWGSWQNSGFVWVMYDALNDAGKSAYSALNVSNRIWTFDQFVFLDYRTDLNYGTPELMAKVTVSTADRDNFAIILKRYDVETAEIESHTPVMFSEHSRDLYNEGYNFVGQQNGSAVSGVLTVNFDHFTEELPQGKTLNDYLWGVEIAYVNTDSGKTPTVKQVELLQNGVSVYKKSSLNDLVTEGNSKTYMLDTRLASTFKLPLGVTLAAQSGSSFVSPAGSTVSFTIGVNNGYKVNNYLNVFHNGTRIIPVNGVYSYVVTAGDFGSNVIKVEGVQPNNVTLVDISKYGNGFEIPYGTYWMVFTIEKSAVNPDVVDMDAISTGSYKYTIRITVDGVAYDLTPDSYYDFGSSLLFRVNVADQGWFPTLNKTYNAKIEICYQGVVIYRDSSYSVTCTTEPTSTKMSAHTHTFEGEIVAQQTASCSTAGKGYRRCTCNGCKAMKEVTIPADNTAHNFSNDLIVTKNATHTERGEFSCVCTVCGATSFAGYFDAPKCDATGDNEITVTDVTAVLNILAEEASPESAACDLDFNGDGIFSVKDLTYILILLSKA